MNTKILCFSLLFIFSSLSYKAETALSETIVSGFITSNTAWTLTESPFIVEDSVFVNSGVTLTIEPGVVVKANKEKAIQIDGELIAIGEPDNMITFTSNQPSPTPGDWGYLHFTDSSIDAVLDNGNYVHGSILKYCNFEFGGDLTLVGYIPPGGGVVRIHGSSPLVTKCLIENNDNSGIEIRDGAAPTISFNTIRENFGRNGGGILVKTNGSALITNNLIQNNSVASKGVSGYGPAGGGIFAEGDSIKIEKNIIRNNVAWVGGGVHVEEGSTLSSNIISYNSTDSIDGLFGAGINIRDGASAEKNIIANNIATNRTAGVMAEENTTISNNSIVNNILRQPKKIVSTAAGGVQLMGATFTYNTLTGNTVPNETDVGGISNYWDSSVISNNNIFNNTGYEFLNEADETSNNINAENNWWGTLIESEIQEAIFDWFDDSSLGLVDYIPFETAIRTDVPISPPTGLSATKKDNNIILNWTANPETDKAGYIVYWGLKSEFPYSNSVNVNNSTSYTITGITEDVYYITITAYDSTYSPSNDDPATLVNENQTDGNESWYAKEVTIGEKASGKMPIIYMVLPGIISSAKK